ncbi:MAG: alpha/beta fold hydrolase [Planctomycetota bacterium]
MTKHSALPPRAFGGFVVTEHRFALPLRPDGSGEIEVFAREVRDAERDSSRFPWLVFLQGGPGHGAPRPTEKSGWIGRAVENFRVLLLDQRGTGLSTPVSAQALARLETPEAQAEYLSQHRSDAIVRDCEAIRRELAGDEPWTVLGQSYGGFCATRYLSAAPEGLAGVLITGGLPPLSAHPDDIYRRTYRIVRERNGLYYERYPEDVEHVRRIVELLDARDVRLPSGDRLSPRRFQTLGIQLGFSDGFEVLHNLFEQAFVPGSDGFAYGFLRAVENASTYDVHPIFSLLHEACYTQGFASRWSAQRVRAEFPEFEPDRADGPVLLTGEMIYPWKLEEIGALRPLRAAGELLAEKEDWPTLYDPARLAANDVPAAAAVYVHDMYVEVELSKETAAAIRGLRPWVSEEHLHNALRSDGPAVLHRLLASVSESAQEHAV